MTTAMATTAHGNRDAAPPLRVAACGDERAGVGLVGGSEVVERGDTEGRAAVREVVGVGERSGAEDPVVVAGVGEWVGRLLGDGVGVGVVAGHSRATSTSGGGIGASLDPFCQDQPSATPGSTMLVPEPTWL
jgi:hypothetical protein